MQPSKYFKWVVALVFLVGGLAPLVAYYWLFGRVSSKTSEDALQELSQPGAQAVLVDVRPADEFAQMHVEGAVHWPLAEIMALHLPAEMPVELRGRTLFLICNSGLQSAQAVARLQSIGVEQVFSVRGGIQSWIRAGAEQPQLNFSRMVYQGEIGVIYQPMPLFQQIATIISGFGFKPLHMLLSLGLFVLLLRQKASDLKIIGLGVGIFLASETACAVNYLLFDHNAYLAEYLHSFGMAVSFGVVLYGAIEALDVRLVHLRDPQKRCMFIGLCRECVKSGHKECKSRRLFQLSSGMLVVLGFLPLVAQPTTASYNTDIFGTPYHYCRLLLYQYYESRYLPGAAIFLGMLALLAVTFSKDKQIPPLARFFFAASLGALLFSVFRLVLGGIFEENLMWADFWEEATELMFIVGIAAVVWIFRDGLLDWQFSFQNHPESTG
jgi:rhodanese-related sulfurtransferase